MNDPQADLLIDLEKKEKVFEDEVFIDWLTCIVNKSL